jgi:hypothetical protein
LLRYPPDPYAVPPVGGEHLSRHGGRERTGQEVARPRPLSALVRGTGYSPLGPSTRGGPGMADDLKPHRIEAHFTTAPESAEGASDLLAQRGRGLAACTAAGGRRGPDGR